MAERATAGTSEVERLRAQVRDLESTLAERERKLETAHEWVMWATNEIDRHRERVAALEGRAEDQSERIDALETAAEAQAERIASLEREVREHTQRIETLEGDVSEHRERIGHLEGELEAERSRGVLSRLAGLFGR